MDKCRACLASEKDLIPMDVSFLQNFNLLTGLSLTMSDKSLLTCKSCCDAVKFFVDFRKRCIASDLNYQEMFVSVNVQEIKHENVPSKDKNNCILLVKDEMKSETCKEYLNDNENDDNDGFATQLEEFDITSKNKSNSKKRKGGDKIYNKNVIKSKINDKHSDSKVNCGLCNSKFDDRNQLSQHLEYHKSLFDTQVSCGLCTERFTNLPHMLGHRLEHVPDDQRICHICSKKFIASSSTCLEFHYMRAHGMAEKDAQIQCKQCPSSYATSKKLLRHVRDCHSPPRYKCQLCKNSFRNRTLLNIHSKMKHVEGNRVECELCNFSSKYANSLMLHTRRKHTLNTFSCKACYRVFLDEQSLSKHVADVCKHHTRVVCSVCGHTVKKVWLKHHMRSHSDEYPFKCDKCPAQYKYRTGLKDHSDKHKGTFSFHCNLCTKSFCIKSALQSHLRTHTGEKPFVCEICKVGFKRRYNLKAHMNAHPWSASEHGHDKINKTNQ